MEEKYRRSENELGPQVWVPVPKMPRAHLGPAGSLTPKWAPHTWLAPENIPQPRQCKHLFWEKIFKVCIQVHLYTCMRLGYTHSMCMPYTIILLFGHVARRVSGNATANETPPKCDANQLIMKMLISHAWSERSRQAESSDKQSLWHCATGSRVACKATKAQLQTQRDQLFFHFQRGPKYWVHAPFGHK